MRHRPLLTLACMASLSACASVTFSNTRLESIQRELNRQFDLWKSQSVPSYEYSFTRFCFCGTDLQRTVLVDVVNSKLSVVTYTDNGSAVPAAAFPSYFTVEGLFGQVQSAIDLQSDSLVVEYDPLLHYPTKILVDQDRLILNDELALFASELKAKP